MTKQCSQKNCCNKHHAKGFCLKHYKNYLNHGSAQAPSRHKDLTGNRFGALMVLEHHSVNKWLCLCDCGALAIASTSNLNRGKSISCGNKEIHRKGRKRQKVILYRSAHTRLQTDRGRASSYVCVDCPNTAEDWSYNYSDPDALVSGLTDSLGLLYSLDSKHYSPRCKVCHRNFDLSMVEYRKDFIDGRIDDTDPDEDLVLEA